jgi:hypothetical protein
VFIKILFLVAFLFIKIFITVTMIYLIGIVFIAIVFITSNIPPDATITAQNITTTIDIAQMTVGLDSYAKICYDSKNTLKILESITFASNLSADVAISILNSFDTVIPQLDEKYQVYLVDMTASIKTNANLNQIFDVTNQPVSETTAIAEFKQTKVMLLDHVDSIRKDIPTTPTPTTTSIQYHNTMLACLLATVVIVAFTTNIISG